MTTHLRFPSEARAQLLMPYAFDPELPAPYGLTVDIIGTIHKATGAMIQALEGEQPEMAAVIGYHVNLRGDVPEALQEFAVVPNSPSRVFL